MVAIVPEEKRALVVDPDRTVSAVNLAKQMEVEGWAVELSESRSQM